MKKELIIKTLKGEGRKLGFLLSNSSLPEKLKLEILNLIDVMDSQQIKRLIDILEAQYLDVNTQDIDKKFIDDNK
jgi:hypothetical protein